MTGRITLYLPNGKKKFLFIDHSMWPGGMIRFLEKKTNKWHISNSPYIIEEDPIGTCKKCGSNLTNHESIYKCPKCGIIEDKDVLKYNSSE